MKRMHHSFLALVCIILTGLNPTLAESSQLPRFAGIEYFGSSQVTRLELQKMLGLKPGASARSVQAAVERVSKRLESMHLTSNIETVLGSAEQLFVVVDVMDSGTDMLPTRKLDFPRHVQVKTEKPFLLLEQLNSRLSRLAEEGRNASEQLNDYGCLFFSDEPCNQLVQQIVKYAPQMKDELLAVVASDTELQRREQAIELLNWAGSPDEVADKLIDALDDSAQSVRIAAARFLFRRIQMLSSEFPYLKMADAFARLINRPSHQDRTKGLYCLLALCERRDQVLPAVKRIAEKRIKELEEESILPTIKNPAKKLLVMFASEPAHRPVLPWLR